MGDSKTARPKKGRRCDEPTFFCIVVFTAWIFGVDEMSGEAIKNYNQALKEELGEVMLGSVLFIVKQSSHMRGH